MPGNLVWFFKDGGLGWTSVITLYTPIGSFGIWAAVFTYLTWQNVNRGLIHHQDLTSAG